MPVIILHEIICSAPDLHVNFITHDHSYTEEMTPLGFIGFIRVLV